MSKTWGSGDPSTHINTNDHVAYDDHPYAQWIVPEGQRTRKGYLDWLCTTDRMSESQSPRLRDFSESVLTLGFYSEYGRTDNRG